MKKVLVHTHFNIPNYGANLQAEATKLLFRHLGYSAIYADIRSENLSSYYSANICTEQAAVHTKYIKENLKITPRIRDMTDYQEHLKTENYDLLCSGSDAVFKLGDIDHKPNFEESYPNPFWLPLSDIPKISISPSCMGTEPYKSVTPAQRIEISRNFEQFKFISVRDKWSKLQLEKFSRNIVEVRDPVFYLPFLDEKFTPIKTQNYIVTALPKYFSTKFRYQLSSLFEQSGYKVLDIGTPELTSMRLTPLEWYQLITNSSGYVGVRFHPLVVAASHGVPLYCLDQYARTWFVRDRSKSYLMLNDLNLEHYHSTKIGYRITSARKIHKAILSQIKHQVNQRERVYETLSTELSNLLSALAYKLK